MRRTVGIIAGNGTLPIEIAEALAARGERPFIVGIADEPSDAIAAFDHVRLDWGRFGNLFSLLEGESVHDVVFAGGVRRRPKLRLRHLDWTTVKAVPSLVALLMSGDDSILSGVAEMFEEHGFRMCGVADVAPSLLLTKSTGSVRSPEQIELGVAIVRALGPFDVGQGAIVCGKRAVAVEGLEGTDAMIERVEELRATGRLRDERDGVLVKVPKPGQDRRFDLPAIGPHTVTRARAAGLRGIAGEAGGMIVLERERTERLLRTHGMFLHAVEP